MLLLRTLDGLHKVNAVAAVKLDVDLVVEIRLALVETAGLDDDVAGHDVEARVKARAAVGAEEVAVVLSRSASYVTVLGSS
jgi:hypothetical protein